MKYSTQILMLSTALAVIGLTGCDHRTWATVDSAGCKQEDVDKMNESLKNGDPMAAFGGAMAMGACKLQGKGEFAGEFRCDDNKTQVACKEK